MNSLPNKLLTLRKHYNFSQGFVAKNVGMDIFSYMAVENGRMMADYEQLRKIAAFYHLDIAELIDNRREVTLKEYNKHYDTDKIDLTMIGKELKPKKTLKDILGSSYFFAFIVALIFMVVIVHYLPKNANNSLEQIYSPIDQLSASDTSVVYLYGNQLLSRGDNSNGQLDYAQIDNVLKAKEGTNFTIILKKDGSLASAGLNSKYLEEVGRIDDALDIAAGKTHVLVLHRNHSVSAIGSNNFGECDTQKWEGIRNIYAGEYGSVGISDKQVYVSGIVPFAEEIKTDTKGVYFDNDSLFLINADNTVSCFSPNNYITSYWENVIDIAIGENFVAGLRKDGKVYILIDNYLIENEVEQWTGIQAIEAGKDYLVAFDGTQVYGVGNNNYDQFDKSAASIQQLPDVRNIHLIPDGDVLRITFDPVMDATSYQIEIDLGIGYSVKVDEPKAEVELSRFNDDQQYLIRITALSDSGQFTKSDTSFAVFTKPKKQPETTPKDDEEPLVIEIPFKIDVLEGKTVNNFNAYISGLGVDPSKVSGHEDESPCAKGQDEPIIIRVIGLTSNESITKTELFEREIEYYYCKLVNEDEQ